MFSLNRVWSESHHICFSYKMRFNSVSGALFFWQSGPWINKISALTKSCICRWNCNWTLVIEPHVVKSYLFQEHSGQKPYFRLFLPFSSKSSQDIIQSKNGSIGCGQTDATTPIIVGPTMLRPFARGHKLVVIGSINVRTLGFFECFK